jgi:protein subunit release factor B
MLSSKLELSFDKENADSQIQNFKNQIDDQSQTNTKLRRLEESIMERNSEIESLKRKMEKQEKRSQQTINNLQIELKEAKNNTLNCDDLVKKIKEKENEI